MKKFILPLIATVFSISLLIGCESSATKVSDAEQDVVDAQAKLDQVRKDSIADYEATQAAWQVQIAKNELAIAEYKERVAQLKADQRASDEDKLAEMESRNAELKVSVTEFGQNGNLAWYKFKAGVKTTFEKFDEEMTTLGNSIEAKVQPNKK